MAGHAWCGEDGTKERCLLGYVDARKKIYVPALHWVLENVSNVKEELRNLVQAATQVSLDVLESEALLGKGRMQVAWSPQKV